MIIQWEKQSLLWDWIRDSYVLTKTWGKGLRAKLGLANHLAPIVLAIAYDKWG